MQKISNPHIIRLTFNVEEYLNGTDSTKFVDYTKPESNISTLK